ncbi:hypothetical protein COV61_00175 [Candidatus Micrarchaeota archaeon CG11_big_fil_rev_8_21_14_0_20_47_5]|nr:MAG: hypothetical protein AUJ17_03645 [Candidatus Micrarchaeota archaeon CG1_02_47_40]PIN84425.1 MAG: hypothetical protein COV61_00175 [Candidatus Micrarchaeota archaeon CG11_big_fil_rev_8_21_14_0_20_47_5]
MKKPDLRKKYVVFADESVKHAYEKLAEGKSEDKQLYQFINRAFDDLKKNPFIGIKIPKNVWPAEYIRRYGINNLWKYDLPNGWRLIYTLKGGEVEIVSIILEWFDHKNYERRFGY